MVRTGTFQFQVDANTIYGAPILYLDMFPGWRQSLQNSAWKVRHFFQVPISIKMGGGRSRDEKEEK